MNATMYTVRRDALRGRAARKPKTRKFVLRWTAEMHDRVRLAAAAQDQSAAEWVRQAVRKKLQDANDAQS